MPLSRQRRRPEDAIDDVRELQAAPLHTRRSFNEASGIVELPETPTYRRQRTAGQRPTMDEGRQKNLMRLSAAAAGITGVGALFGNNTLAQAGAGLSEGVSEGFFANQDQYSDELSVYLDALADDEATNAEIARREAQDEYARAVAMTEQKQGRIDQGRERGQELGDERRADRREQRRDLRDHEQALELERLRQRGRKSLINLRGGGSDADEAKDAGTLPQRANALMQEALEHHNAIQRASDATLTAGDGMTPAELRQSAESRSEALQNLEEVMRELSPEERRAMIENYFGPAIREVGAEGSEPGEGAELMEAIQDQMQLFQGLIEDIEADEAQGGTGEQQGGQQQAEQQAQQQLPQEIEQHRGRTANGVNAANQLIGAVSGGQMSPQEMVEVAAEAVESGELTEAEGEFVLDYFMHLMQNN